MDDPNKFSKEIETIKNKGILELKNIMEEFNKELKKKKKKADSAFRRISNLEDKKFETV